MPQVRVLLFARLREIAGSGTLQRDVGADWSVERVWDDLTLDVPNLAPHRAALSAAVNAEFAPFTTPVRDGDEIAFLPPVSGG